MKKLYPWIDDMITLVANRIHFGESPVQAIASIQDRHAFELGRVQESHLPDVLAKLGEIAEMLRINMKDHPINVQPQMCPSCRSLDTAGGRCRWCHHQVE